MRLINFSFEGGTVNEPTPDVVNTILFNEPFSESRLLWMKRIDAASQKSCQTVGIFSQQRLDGSATPN
jgi:hypothetical protein